MAAIDATPTYDLALYKGIAKTLTFTCTRKDESGNVLGPFDLTGYELILIVRDIYKTDLNLSNLSSPDANGSYINVIGDPTLGKFTFRLSSITNDGILSPIGDWQIKRRSGPGTDELFLKGTVTVIPLRVGGEI